MEDEALAAIKEFVAARREHHRLDPDPKPLTLREFVRTEARYEAALAELERIADEEGEHDS